MLAVGKKHAPQIDYLIAIQAQGCDGGASCRREANDLSVVSAPGEMLAPLLLTRVKQRHEFMCGRITCF